MRIELDDLTRPAVHALLREHLAAMAHHSPPESMHALDVTGLRRPEIAFFTAWEGEVLLGCGALKALDATHVEIKSMRTANAHLRKGVARFVLTHLLDEARRRGFERVSLETGAMEAFAPAHRLYHSFGFERCAPFGDYREDRNSVFMTRAL